MKTMELNPMTGVLSTQLCIGKQRVSREPQEGSEEHFDVSLQVPHVHQPRISPVRERHKEFIREFQQTTHVRFI